MNMRYVLHLILSLTFAGVVVAADENPDENNVDKNLPAAGASIGIDIGEIDISNVDGNGTDDVDDDDDEDNDEDDYYYETDDDESICELRRVTMDAIFLIDGSWSITSKDFKMGKRFVFSFFRLSRQTRNRTRRERHQSCRSTILGQSRG